MNSTKGEAFLKRDDLHFFIRLFKTEDDFENDAYYFKYGVIVNSPFEESINVFEHSSYLERPSCGGERTDIWLEQDFQGLLEKAHEIAIPWIQEMMELKNLANHIQWRIDEEIRWLEPEQFKENDGQLSGAGNKISNLFGGQGIKICHKWVKRFHKPRAIILNIDAQPEKALENMHLYLEHIQEESCRENEIKSINEKLNAKIWPVSI